MVHASRVKVTVALTDPTQDEEEKETEINQLLWEIRELDEVEAVNRVVNPNPPEGSKALGGFLVGLLNAEVNMANTKKLFGFLGDRLGNKPLKLKVKAPDGRELEVEASSRQEFDYVMHQAQEFLNK
ncbi:MAG: sugar ABC transporter permease [Calothrix sp. SM1_7_51]|nr:sugar ABC transporter permease [Calothrix sp. SM1_7_51]